MSSPNPDNTVDFGTVDPAGLPHEFIAKRTDGNVATVLATVTRIEDKVDHLTHKVDHLIGEVATLARPHHDWHQLGQCRPTDPQYGPGDQTAGVIASSCRLSAASRFICG
jgi:hypothetical protein